MNWHVIGQLVQLRYQLLWAKMRSRAGSIVALMLGAAWIPPAALLWATFAPRPLDARVLLMPVMNAVTALFLFQGFGLWTSTYAPRRANYDKVFGNDMSPLGNLAFLGTMFGSMWLPSLLRTCGG